MGRHSKIEPKRISFLGSAGGIFAAMALIGSIFAVSQLAGDSPIAKPPIERHIDGSTPRTKSTNIVPAPTVMPTVSGTVPETVIVVSPVQVPTQPPLISPTPKPSPGTTTVDVEVHAETPAVGLDTDVEIDVPLLGQAVETVTDITDTLIGLLDK